MTESHDSRVEDLPAHPVGTLVIVLIYGVLFVVGWAWMYFGQFLGRGAPVGP
jgi:hypothetical protein